jgi:hypothetical protein
VQREIGWGTVVDATYVGSRERHLEVVQNINVVPDGTRYLDLNPQNRNPQNTANPLPPEFLRPYRGYQNINIRSHFGTSDYNALQVQINRRYIRGLQFAVAYTYGRRAGSPRGTRHTIARPLTSGLRPYSSASCTIS